MPPELLIAFNPARTVPRSRRQRSRLEINGSDRRRPSRAVDAAGAADAVVSFQKKQQQFLKKHLKL